MEPSSERMSPRWGRMVSTRSISFIALRFQSSACTTVVLKSFTTMAVVKRSISAEMRP
jgi:hypothetical protein